MTNKYKYHKLRKNQINSKDIKAAWLHGLHQLINKMQKITHLMKKSQMIKKHMYKLFHQ